MEWPSYEESNGGKTKVSASPYAVISRYAEALYNMYDNKLLGIVTARYFDYENTKGADFIYSLYIARTQADKAIQLKLLEFKVQDDGWYPVTVSIYRGNLVGDAANEEQLHTLINNAINSDFVKAQLKSLLN